MTLHITEAERELCVLIGLNTKWSPRIFLKVAGNQSLTWLVKALGEGRVSLNKSHRGKKSINEQTFASEKDGSGL